MSNLLFLQRQLEKAGAELGSLNRALAENPGSRSLVAMTESMTSARSSLEQAYLEEADALGVDVCSYRIFGDEAPTLSALTSILGTFQTLFSVIYGSVKDGTPKSRARVSPDTQADTLFRFGYSYPGSVGMVLTLPNDRMLIGDSKLDESIRVAFEMAQAETPEEVGTFARTYGPASVRAMYKWAHAHSAVGLGAEIGWRRATYIRNSLVLQAPELDRLAKAIELTGEVTEVDERLSGMLVAIDSDRRTFRVSFEGADEIHGRLADALALDEPARVPARYRVSLTKQTTVRYAMDDDQVTWQLNRLDLA